MDRPDGVVGRAVAAGVHELQGHDRRGPVDADDAHAVVAHGADGAGRVGAVAVVVERVVRVVDEVPADQVVDVRGVAVLGDAVGPAAQAGVVAVGVLLHRREDVGGVDAAVAVDVGDLARALDVTRGGLFRSWKVMSPSPSTSVRFAMREGGISAWLIQMFW